MKKITALFAVFLMCFSIIACTTEEDVSDEEKIIDRLIDLQNSINNDNYSNFIQCMHTGTDFFDSITPEVFETLFGAGVYYLFYDSVITFPSEGTAHVDCYANINGTEGFETDFTLQTEDKDWYIFEWYEEGFEIYNSYVTFP